DDRRKRSRDDGRIQGSQQHRQQQTAEDDENLTVGEGLVGDRLWGSGGGEGDGTRTAGGYQQPVSSSQPPANSYQPQASSWSPAAGSWLLQVGCSSPARPTHLSPRVCRSSVPHATLRRIALRTPSKGPGMELIILLVIVLAIAFIVMSMYNRLVSLRNRFKNAFAQIDVQLKRRYELIPNLVETAKGYMKHERETLDAVITARNTAMSAERKVAADPSDAAAMQGLIGAEQGLGAAMTRFFALSEAYPDLKADAHMRQLSE